MKKLIALLTLIGCVSQAQVTNMHVTKITSNTQLQAVADALNALGATNVTTVTTNNLMTVAAVQQPDGSYTTYIQLKPVVTNGVVILPPHIPPITQSSMQMAAFLTAAFGDLSQLPVGVNTTNTFFLGVNEVTNTWQTSARLR